MKNIFLSLIGLLFLFSCQSGKTLMELNLQEGQTYHQKSEVQSNIKQHFAGREMEIGMLITGDMSYTVKEVGDGYFDLEAQYERMQMDAKMPMMEISINSEDEQSDNPMEAILSKMIGQTFTVRMGKNGKILDVKGLEEIYAHVLEEMGSDIDPQKLKQLKTQIQQAHGKEAMLGNMQMASTIFSDEPIKVGDSWEKEIQVPMNGQLATHQVTYTLLRKDKDRYYLKAFSDLSIDEDLKNGGVSLPIPMKFEMDGEMNSEIVLDAQTGWIKTVNTRQQVKGKIRMEKNDRVSEGMEMPMEYDITMRTTD